MWGRSALPLLGLLAASAAAQEPTPRPTADARAIARLIQQLGDGRYAVREEATRKLAEIGAAAVPALRQAARSDDPEIRIRARRLLQTVEHPTPEQLAQRRRSIREAFQAGDYPRMIRLSMRLTAAKSASLLDWLWLGHGCQLAGRWREAVEAYQKVVRLMPDPASNVAGEILPPPDAKGIIGPHSGPVNGPLQRTVLSLWIARIQTAKLHDVKAAAAQLTEALGFFEKAGLKGEHLRRQLLTELAAAQHSAGDLRGAFRTWAKLQATPGAVGYAAIGRIVKALSQLPPGEPLPAIPSLFVLTPEQPGTKLLLNEAPTRARSYRPHGRPTSPHWRYAFAPPPGKEFATIEFACDIEQLQPRYGGAFSCYVPTGGEAHALRHLASAGWPSDKPPGRGIVRRRVDVPPGVRAVHIKTGSWQGHFHVHSVEVKATFRPAARNVKLPRLRPQAWVQTEALPAGGRLTYGRKELSPGSAYSDFEPGKYRLRYEVPGRAAKFEADFVVEPGGRYGIFANLDSPFRWRQTAIRDLGRHPAARASIARLPDGSYLAVWCGVGSKLMVSRSRDLVTWAKGERLPFSSIFADVSPAILTARNGTVYLAYFSQRLYLLDLSTAGYQLWLTSTRDGRKWSPLKPIPIAGAVDGWPIGAVQMLEGPDGRARIYWRHYAAVGKSIAEAPQLSPTNVIGGRPGIHPWNPHVSVDARGLYHLVFGDFGQGIYHTTSKDGLDWAVPAALVQGGRAANPQLIHARGRALLLCERNDGAYLAPTQLDRRPGRVGRAVKITNHVVPLAGARVAMTPDGEAVLLAGGSTTWLLRAKLKALTALRAHK